MSFFVKKKVHDELGMYDEKLKFCADYDFFFKLFKNKQYKFASGKRNELVGFFNSEGISSKIGFFKTLYYETKVRSKNNQSLIVIIVLIILRILNKVRNKLFYFR